MTNISGLQLFQVMQFGTAILIGILLAKSSLPTEQISTYEALVFIASMLCFFWIVGGQNTLLQLFPELNEAQKKRALFNVYVLFTAAAALTGGLLFLSQNIVTQRLTKFTELPHLDLLSLFLLFNCPTFLIQIYYLLLKKYKAIVTYGAISFLLQIIVVALPIYAGFTLRETIWGLVAWAVFKYAWGIVLLIKYAHWEVDFLFLKKYMPLVWPLLLFAFIGKGSDYVSGLAVTMLFDDENAFAVFRYGAREFPLAVLMVGALATSLIPEISGDLTAGLQRIKDTTRRLSHWLYPLSMASMLVAPLLFPIIFNKDFSGSARIFNIFTLLLTSRILLPQVVLIGQKKNHILVVSAVVELVAIALLSWWLGSIFGLEGVAYAAVIGFMVDKLMMVFYNWQVLKIPVSAYLDVRIYLIYNGLLIFTFLLSLQIGT